MVMKNKTQIGRERRRRGSQLDDLELQGLHAQHSHQLFPTPLILCKLGYLLPKPFAKKPQQLQTQVL